MYKKCPKYQEHLLRMQTDELYNARISQLQTYRINQSNIKKQRKQLNKFKPPKILIKQNTKLENDIYNNSSVFCDTSDNEDTEITEILTHEQRQLMRRT